MIAVDIGNTSLHFVLFNKNKIESSFKLQTEKTSELSIKKVLSKYSANKIFVCSVVPRITKLFQALKKDISIKKEIFIVNKDISVPILSFYNKKSIGMDRLVGAYAAKKIYPETRLLLDFGTAITLDFLSKKGDYLGGIILPGIGSTLKAFSNCALLPKKINFTNTKNIIPKDTNESINQGMKEGFSLMINGLVNKYAKKLKISNTKKIIITGGEAEIIIPALKFPYIYEPFLVVKGLKEISENLNNNFMNTKYLH